MARKKSKTGSRGQRRSDKAKRRLKKKRVQSAAPRDPLRTVHPNKALAPVYLGRSGQVVADPYATLGISENGATPARIRATWRDLTVAAGVEQDPERVAALRNARDRLLLPDKALERELGVVHLPDPDAWGLPPASAPVPTLDPRLRLLTQAVMYALLEDDLAE